MPLGPDTQFFWLRAKFPETSSSQLPSNFREISGISALFSLPRLKRSGIEYVILAGSSLFMSSGVQSRHESGLAPSCWRTAREFLNVFNFFAFEIENFRSPAGASLGSEGSRGLSQGRRSGFFPETGQISREISGILFCSEGSYFQRNF